MYVLLSVFFLIMQRNHTLTFQDTQLNHVIGLSMYTDRQGNQALSTTPPKTVQPITKILLKRSFHKVKHKETHSELKEINAGILQSSI